MNDSIANRVKRNPRMCTIHTHEKLKATLSGLTNRQVWLLQFQKMAVWQKSILLSECKRREEEFEIKQRMSGCVNSWWAWYLY